MPLIRYDIGDLARVSSEPCACGSPLPTLDELAGRVVEHFVRPDGDLVFGGNFIAMFYEHDWITGFHVLQEALDQIRIFYTKAPGIRPPEDAIRNLNHAVRRVMGTSCRVAWEEVDAVPKSPIGKHLHTPASCGKSKLGSTLGARCQVKDTPNRSRLHPNHTGRIPNPAGCRPPQVLMPEQSTRESARTSASWIPVELPISFRLMHSEARTCR